MKKPEPNLGEMLGIQKRPDFLQTLGWNPVVRDSTNLGQAIPFGNNYAGATFTTSTTAPSTSYSAASLAS